MHLTSVTMMAPLSFQITVALQYYTPEKDFQEAGKYENYQYYYRIRSTIVIYVETGESAAGYGDNVTNNTNDEADHSDDLDDQMRE